MTTFQGGCSLILNYILNYQLLGALLVINYYCIMMIDLTLDCIRVRYIEGQSFNVKKGLIIKGTYVEYDQGGMMVDINRKVSATE